VNINYRQTADTGLREDRKSVWALYKLTHPCDNDTGWWRPHHFFFFGIDGRTALNCI
jgi:hypothetical protein